MVTNGEAPEGPTGVISVIRAPAVWRDRQVPYVVEVDGMQLAALMPKEEARLLVLFEDSWVTALVMGLAVTLLYLGVGYLLDRVGR